MKQRTNWILVGALSTLMAGCAMGLSTAECPERDRVKVKSKRGELSIKPECITVARGGTFTLEMEDRQPAGKARTKPEKQEHNWLKRTNETGQNIVITVPDAPSGGDCDASGCYFKYELEVDGIGVLDPRVRVR